MRILKIPTIYNGAEVLGGILNTETRVFVKRAHNVNAGKHPHLPHYGGIDSNILDVLKDQGCIYMELHVPTGSFYITFEGFLKFSYPIKWKNPVFYYPRYYCPIQHWSRTKEDMIMRARESKQKPKLKEEQASLFCPEELQDLSMKERLIS